MTTLLIKICGLSTADALEVALAAGADMVGFVFFPPSPRHIDHDAARTLGAQVHGRAQKVALSVDATDADLAAAIDTLKPDMLQLHGKETPERVAAIRSRFGLPVMKALAISERSDLAAIRLYDKIADRLIFDARPPRDATRPGGLGRSFDWYLLQETPRPRSPICCPADWTPATSPRLCASRRRRASTCRPGSSAHPAKRTRKKYARSSGPRAQPRRRRAWRFRSPHHSCREFDMRTSEPKPH